MFERRSFAVSSADLSRRSCPSLPLCSLENSRDMGSGTHLPEDRHTIVAERTRVLFARVVIRCSGSPADPVHTLSHGLSFDCRSNTAVHANGAERITRNVPASGYISASPINPCDCVCTLIYPLTPPSSMTRTQSVCPSLANRSPGKGLVDFIADFGQSLLCVRVCG